MLTKLLHLPRLLSLLVLVSCGGGGGAPAIVTPPAPQSLTVSGASQVLAGGGSAMLSAATDVPATVSWSLEQGPGKLSAATGGSVSYSPPADGVSVNTPVQIKVSAGALTQTYRLTVFPDPGAPGLRLIAGTLGSTGNLDGDADQARFTDIRRMAPDIHGNLYLLDNGLLRKVDASGRVTTLAPSGVLDVSVSPDNVVYLLAERDGKQVVLTLSDDGSTSVYLTAEQTEQSAYRIVAAAMGKLYLLGDTYVLAAGAGANGIVAGSSDDFQAACADGTGAGAHLGSIADAVLDASGNLLLQACASVRQVRPDGVVTTLAGALLATPVDQQVDGTGAQARFGNLPYASLTSDSSGNIRVLDQVTELPPTPVTNYRLRSVSRAGVVQTLARGAVKLTSVIEYGGYGQPSAPNVVRYLSNGKLIVASRAQLWQADAQGALTRYAGDEGDIAGTRADSLATARFVNPRAAAADLAGNLYVLADGGVGNISGYKIALDGSISPFLQSDALAQPIQLLPAPDGGFFMVTRGYPTLAGHNPGSYTQVYRLSIDGVPQLLAGRARNILTSADAVDGPADSASFFAAELVGVDAGGNLYARDTNRYRKITPQGTVSTVDGLPAGVGVMADGYRYEVDRGAALVYRVAADGSRTIVAGTAGQDGNRIGALPGSLKQTLTTGGSNPYGFSAPPALVLAPAGPSSFVLVSGGAILKLVLPH